MDNPLFSQFVADAANIKESGRWAAMNEKIACLAKNPRVGNEWRAQLLGSLCFQVLLEYRRMQDAFAAQRTYPRRLEAAIPFGQLSVWSCISRELRGCLAAVQDAGLDARNVLDVFERWGQTAGQPVDWLSAIADAKMIFLFDSKRGD